MKNLRSLVSGWVLSTGVSTEGSSEQSQGVSEASPHWTEASPVSITAPKAVGIWMQRLWVTVNVQEVFAARTHQAGVDDRIATADCSGGSRMCKRGDRYRNKRFLSINVDSGILLETAGRSAYGQAGSCLTAAEKTEIDWADRIRSDRKQTCISPSTLSSGKSNFSPVHPVGGSGCWIVLSSTAFHPDYVLGVSVDYDRNIQDIFLRDRAADIKQEMA